MLVTYGHQSLSSEDIEAVVNVLQSDFLTQGSAVPIFEEDLCKYTNAKYAVATNNGTSALHLACLAVDLKENEWLWTSPISFVASANVARYCNAKVDFVDIDPLTMNIDVEKLAEKLRLAKQKNKLPKVLIPVHFSGLSCDMTAIKKLSDEYGFFIIEDACHALGGGYEDNKIGSCSFSDLAVFSFHPVKSITTGEGGVVMTNSSSLAEKMMILRTHGITKDPESMIKKEKDGPWYYEQIALGHNYRMTDIQAALGSSQLKRLDKFIEKRNLIANEYSKLLKNLPIQHPLIPTGYYSAFHLYVVRLNLDMISRSRLEIFEDVLSDGIGISLHYIPIHLQPYYKNLGFKEGDFPESEKYYNEAITLPIFVDLSSKDLGKVVHSLKSAIR